MKRVIFYSVSLALLVGLSGCSNNPTQSAESGAEHPAVAPEHANHEHADHGVQSDGMSDMDKMTAELAKLSPEDAASAEKQHVCPVSGDMLGTMGPPLKIDVNGQQVWICCEGCKADLLADPDRYLAKLKEGSPRE